MLIFILEFWILREPKPQSLIAELLNILRILIIFFKIIISREPEPQFKVWELLNISEIRIKFLSRICFSLAFKNWNLRKKSEAESRIFLFEVKAELVQVWNCKFCISRLRTQNQAQAFLTPRTHYSIVVESLVLIFIIFLLFLFFYF